MKMPSEAKGLMKMGGRLGSSVDGNSANLTVILPSTVAKLYPDDKISRNRMK